MKLSVVIPYYNGEKWVGKCLDSLLMHLIPFKLSNRVVSLLKTI